ncbi:MAG TPA: Asp-tRNA(Asn)/Glu-tRNA(Gln) amidotransferase subunit GatC [Holophagaceae bacterium]
MDVTREDVLRCAQLAHLNLGEEEIEPMRRAMAQILSHAESLEELDLANVEPLLPGQGRPLPRRADEPRASFTQAEALANAPAEDRGHFLVPKVL